MDYLEEYYNSYEEEGRLQPKSGQVEYLTTMKYIDECISGNPEPQILEIGAGTGRYSIALARRGYHVTAVELISHNLEVLNSKLDGSEPINVMQGNALDLSALSDESFDITLLLGPLYHLFSREDKLQALSEAVRVTKPGGYILSAYCMSDPSIVQNVFAAAILNEVILQGKLTEDWRCISRPKDLFDLVRTEDIASLDEELPAERIKLVASDGATKFYADLIDAMDDETFSKWLDYHFHTCERRDLVGASHHTLDILRKNR